MFARILTAAVLIPLVLALVWWGPPELLAASAALVAILALLEFLNLAERVGLRAFRYWTLACAAGIFYAQYSAGFVETHSFSGWSIMRETTRVVPLDGVIMVFVLGMAVVGISTRRPMYEVLPGMAASAAGLLFVALPFSYLVRIDQIERSGRRLVLFTLFLMWAGDTLAYLGGRMLGRHKMAPMTSPGKTWEGFVFGTAATVLVAFLALYKDRHDFLTVWQSIVLGVVLAVVAPLGDLFESLLKRDVGVKDSGTMLGGHGGMLDRLDAFFFAAPAAYFVILAFT